MIGQLLPAALFALGLAALVAGLVLAAGWLPWRQRPPGLQRPAAAIAVAGFALALLLLAASSLRLAWSELSLPVAIIAGGLAVLAGPLLFQAVPRRFGDSRAGALAGAAIALVLAGLQAGTLQRL